MGAVAGLASFMFLLGMVLDRLVLVGPGPAVEITSAPAPIAPPAGDPEIRARAVPLVPPPVVPAPVGPPPGSTPRAERRPKNPAQAAPAEKIPAEGRSDPAPKPVETPSGTDVVASGESLKRAIDALLARAMSVRERVADDHAASPGLDLYIHKLTNAARSTRPGDVAARLPALEAELERLERAAR